MRLDQFTYLLWVCGQTTIDCGSKTGRLYRSSGYCGVSARSRPSVHGGVFDNKMLWDDRLGACRGSHAGPRRTDPRHQVTNLRAIERSTKQLGNHEVLRSQFSDLQIRIEFPGGHRSRVTPVPIPNTEVKPATADGTACVGAWESRSLPGLFSNESRRFRRVSGFCFVYQAITRISPRDRFC